MKSIAKKIGIAVSSLLLIVVVFFTMMMSACTIETNHPRVKITLEFNEETYVLEYKLYRNMYPNTVRHFIELAKSGFYDDTIIHDYSTSDMVGGGYSYDDNETNGYDIAIKDEFMEDYLEIHDKEAEYTELAADGTLTPSVYATEQKTGAYRTLIGEYSSSYPREIENGELTDGYGALKMFHYEMEDDSLVYVTHQKNELVPSTYNESNATSLFVMQIGSGTSYGYNDYCTFGEIRDTDDLDDFVEAVEDYIEDFGEDSDVSDFLYDTKEVEVCNLDESKEDVDKGKQVTFSVPKTAIIVRSVKVTRY